MERLSVSVVYFSPTRTSAAIARAIAAGMGNVAVKEYDITCDAPESIRLDSDIAIMAVPVYGGRVAETAVERLKHVSTSVALAVPVVVYGNRDYEDALLELKDIIGEQGFVSLAAAAFIGEHSYSRPEMPIAEGRPDAEDLEKARNFGATIVAKFAGIKKGKELRPLQVKGYYPYRVKGTSAPIAPVVDAEKCLLCGVCVDLCPVDAITIAGDKISTDPVLCIKCCACVKYCPEDARSFDTPYTAMLHEKCKLRREPEYFV